MKELKYMNNDCYTKEEYFKALSIRKGEIRLQRKPTSRDIVETKLFLRDFGYTDVEIPPCPTYNALCRWRRDYVVKRMDEEGAND